MFRSFVYINEDAVRRYVEQLPIGEGKLTAKKVNLGAKAGPLKADAEFESAVRRPSIPHLFDEFEAALKDRTDEFFDFLTGDPDPSTLPQMSIVRFRGTAEVPEEFETLSMLIRYAPLFNALGSFGADAGDGSKELLRLLAEGDVCAPLVMQGLGIPVFSKAEMACFAGGDISILEELESEEAVFLAKVLSHCDGEQVVVYDPLRDWVNLGRSARRSIDRSAGLEEIELAGPIIKAELIAIYH